VGTTLQNIYFFPTSEKRVIKAKLQEILEAEGYLPSKGNEAFNLLIHLQEDKEGSCFISIGLTDIASSSFFPRALAQSLNCDVLNASVYDSDYLSLIYYKRETKESIRLDIGIFPDSTYTQNVDITTLYPLLRNKETQEELHRVWQAKYTFAEDRLNDLLVLFGYGGFVLPGKKPRICVFTNLMTQSEAIG